MTKVRFTFVDVQGNPLPLMEFKILLRRASFNAEDVGVALPEDLNVTTDATGQVIVELWPLKAAYRIQVAEEYEELCGKLNWSFYVPQTDAIVEAQTLFLVPAPSNVPWDEEAIGKINQAVIDSHDSAVAADASADRAEEFAQSIAGDAESARQSAADALVSKNAAAVSATAANTSKNAAATSASAALTSQNAAKASETAAKTSETNAKTSETNAKTSETNAGTSRTNAATSATAAAGSATSAATSASTATTGANTATTKAGEAASSAATALTQANRAQTEADRAASSLSGKQDLNANLTALSGLVGAADRLPYFTGAGALSLATITAIGRQLIGGADAAAMRNTLGALATSDVSALIKATGWGLELADQATTLADCNLALVTGIYRSNTSVLNKPVSAGGLLEVKKGFAATLFQIFYATDQTVWWRFTTVSGTNWSVWASFVKSTDLGTAAVLTATTSTTDTTDGRVARIGDHGLGSQVSPFISDMDLPTANGYSWVTSGTANQILGFASGSQVLTFFASVNEVAQMYFSRTTPMRIGTRRKTTGAWQAGTDLVTTAGAILDPSLNTGGILSTSVVSGFRVDKYINGTMCVTGKVALPSIAANVYPYQTLTLPVTFFNTANMVPMLSCNASTSADSYGVVFQRAASTSSVLYAIRNGATAQTFEVNVCVWGTWK